MQEITLEIGQLISFLTDKYGLEFKVNHFTELPFEILFPGFNNEWVPCKKIYKKMAPLYKISFDNDAVLEAADNHLLVDYDKTTKFVKDFKSGDKLFAYECLTNELISKNEEVFSPQIESKDHIYKTADGLVHHNTYEVMEVCNRFVKDSPTKAKYVYEAGDIGSSMSSLVPFFYKHSKNKIIVLDDNDKMIMANLSQDIMNIVKALLDPKAAETKPVTVRANMLKIFQARLEDLEEGDELNESGHWVEIDKEALKEGECVISVDDNIVVNHAIPLREAQKLSNMIRDEEEKPSRKRLLESDLTTDDLRSLHEAEQKSNKEFLSDLIGSDDEEEEYNGMTAEDVQAIKSMKASGATEQGEEGQSFPRRFLFDSSVIFISNLEQDQLNVAVLDRVESIAIKLSLDQFLQRLGKIYGGLCQGAKYSDVPQDLRDWAKKCVYTALGATIEAWKSRQVLWKTPVEINRKLTFRMFEEFVVAWLRYAYDRSERVDGRDLNDKSYRDKLSKELLSEIIRRKMIPVLRSRTKTV
jgi:hypothetical protein